jgi:hypothetical protein
MNNRRASDASSESSAKTRPQDGERQTGRKQGEAGKGGLQILLAAAIIIGFVVIIVGPQFFIDWFANQR